MISPAVSADPKGDTPGAVNAFLSDRQMIGRMEYLGEEAPALERVARSLDGRARVVGVNWTDSLSAARSWVDDYRWTFPNLRDASGSVGSDYGLSGLPTTFIIDSHGRITDVLFGPQSESSLREALESAG
jgi:peroxiredoxin